MDFLEKNSHEEIKEDLKEKWKILIVDDEPEVHVITKLTLRDFCFKNKNIEFFSAYSEKECLNILSNNQDFHIILLDVVMENETSGLSVVEYIRNNLNNHIMRIILRTGQAGLFNEDYICEKYDINDFKNKTELTVQKLKTSLITTLRNYIDIDRIEKNKLFLELITNSLYKFNESNINNFEQIIYSIFNDIKYFKKINQELEYGYVNLNSGLVINSLINNNSNFKQLNKHIQECINQKRIIFTEEYVFIYYGGKTNESDYFDNVFFLKTEQIFSQDCLYCLNILANNIDKSYQNVLFKNEIETSQEEIVNLLGEAVENRSKESGQHVKRVSLISELLAKKVGFSDYEATLVKIAAPLHDLGKIGIPDNILHKNGKLTLEEREIMNTHVYIGYDMLKNSKYKTLRYASIIAEQHHEKWDGSGYPNALKGEEINILGRIVAISDVFDALLSKRCYKEAWTLEDTIQHIIKEKGKHFDPHIVDIFLDNINEINNIINKYKD